MEDKFILYYSESHETSRKPDATGEAAPTSDPVTGEGHDLVGGGSTSRILRKFCFSMAAGLSKGRAGFCSSRIFVGPRHRGEGLPSCIISHRRDRISAISSLIVSPKWRRSGLYFRFQGKNIKTFDVGDFLHHLLQHLRGHVVPLWDKALIHREKPVHEIFDRYPRLDLEWFPGYAPELNPVEFVWTQAKHRLANSVPEGTKELKRMLCRTPRRL